MADLQRELSSAVLKMGELEQVEQEDNSGVLVQEFNAAFQDLNSVVEVS